MIKDTGYVGRLATESSFMLYRVEESLLNQTGYAMLEFSQCMGDTEISFINNPQNLNSKATDI